VLVIVRERLLGEGRVPMLGPAEVEESRDHHHDRDRREGDIDRPVHTFATAVPRK
jgi:hypothetical protein